MKLNSPPRNFPGGSLFNRFAMNKAVFLIVSLLLCCHMAWSQDEPKVSSSADLDEINLKLQNPNADLISLPFQNNTSFGIGPEDHAQNVLNIHPVYPFTFGNVHVITRTIAPIISQPVSAYETDFGLGDILFTAFFAPSKAQKITWGVKPAISFPTATERTLGIGKWSTGPSVVALTQTDSGWTIAGLINHIWSFAGQSDRGDVNFMTFQPFVSLSLPKYWSVNVAPMLTANWEAPSEEYWTLPFLRRCLGGCFFWEASGKSQHSSLLQLRKTRLWTRLVHTRVSGFRVSQIG